MVIRSLLSKIPASVDVQSPVVMSSVLIPRESGTRLMRLRPILLSSCFLFVLVAAMRLGYAILKYRSVASCGRLLVSFG
jgi:hypothetical protein